MASVETVTALIAGISGSDETRRMIVAQALDRSQIDALRPGQRFTSPVVRGVWAGEVEALAVTEGGTKTVASGISNPVSFQTYAVAISIPISNLLEQSQDDLQKSITDQMIAGLARGIDRSILRNTEGVFASSVVAAASGVSNIVVAASPTAITYAEMNSLFGTVEGDGHSVNGVIVREANKGALRLAETTAGNRYFVPADRDTPASIFGAPVGFVKSTGSLPVLPATGTGAEVMAVAGDWTQLVWGMYGDMQIKVNPWAESYFLTNRTLVMAEVYIGFAILNPDAFALLTEPA